MKKLFSSLVFSLLMALSLSAQTPVNMGAQPNGTYSCDFADIASWVSVTATGTLDPAGGTFSATSNALPWVVKRNTIANASTGTNVPNANTIVQSLSAVSSTNFGFSMTSNVTSGGVQRDATGAPGKVVLLATGATDNTTSAAFDLFLDFTGRNAGNLSFDLGAIANSPTVAVGRSSHLVVYASTDGTNWTQLPGTIIATNGNTSNPTATITSTTFNEPLPASFNNSATARLRFYIFNGPGLTGATGNRPRISIDNVVVTSSAASGCTNPISLTLSASNTSLCSGQSTVLNLVNSDPGATVTWLTSTSPAVSGLPAGNTANTVTVTPTATTTYSVNAVNGGCSASTSVTVQVSANPTLAVSSTSSVVCAGGSGATVTAVSNATTLNFEPTSQLNVLSANSFEATPTAPTTYTITATNAAGCSVTSTIFVNYVSSVSVSVVSLSGSNTINCIGGSLQLMITGASTYIIDPSTSMTPATGPGYNYIASPSATTIYTITGTSGVCSGSVTYEVVAANNPLPVVNFSRPNPNSICPGTTDTLNILGTDTYTWNTSPSLSVVNNTTVVLAPTVTNNIYTVTATTPAGCTSTATYSLSLYPAANVYAASNPLRVCNNGPVSLLASGAANYSWSNGSTGMPSVMNPAVSGIYTVVGTDVNGCTSTSVTEVMTTADGAVAYFSFQAGNGNPDSIVECLPFIQSISTWTVSNQNTIPASNYTTGVGTSFPYYAPTANASTGINFGVVTKPMLITGPSPTYVELTINANSGYTSKLDAIEYAVRATSTGAQLMTFRSSADNFTSDIATVPVTNNGAWQYKRVNLGGVHHNTNSSITLRIYLTNGSGNSTAINFRMDDIKLCLSPYSLCVTPSLSITPSAQVSICSNDSIVLNATSSANNVEWTYTNAIGTNTITGNSFTYYGNQGDATYTVVAGTGTCTASVAGTITVTPNPMGTSTHNVFSLPVVVGNQTFTAAGTYTVAYPTTNCDSIHTFTINFIQCPSLGVQIFDPLCNGGNGTVTLTYSNSSVYSIDNQSNTSGIFQLPAGTYTASVIDGNQCSQMTVVTITEPNAINLGIVVTNANPCQGISGGIQYTVSGGVAPYIVDVNGQTVSGGSASLTSGSYTITAIDANGCSVSSTFTISSASPIMFTNVNVTNPGCGSNSLSGSITVSTNYTNANYSVTPSLSQVSSGVFVGANPNTYTVTAMSGSCTTTTVVVVSNVNAPAMNLILQSPTCFGQSNGLINAVVTGGSAPYTFNMTAPASTNSTGLFINLASGIYKITVTDANGCTSSAVALLPQPSQVKFSNIVRTHNTCNGDNTGAISFAVSGGSGMKTTMLNPGSVVVSSPITGLQSNTYTLQATDANGCTRTTTVSLTQPAPLMISTPVVVQPTTANPSAGSIAISATGGTGSKQYNINMGSYQTSGLFNSLGSGVYTLTAKDAKGCTKSTMVALGVVSKVVPFNNKIKVYPNPTNGEVVVNSDQPIVSAMVLNSNGQAINVVMKSNIIDLTGYASGTYYIVVYLQDGAMSYHKIFKQ